MADEDDLETPNPAAPAKDEGQPESDSAEEAKFVPPKDGSWIPRERFNDARQGDRNRIEALEAQLTAERDERIRLEERAKAKAETTPQYTRSQLQGLVDEGKLNQDQADALWEKQLEDRITAKARTEAEQQAKISKRQAAIQGVLTQYRDLRPDAWKAGTEDRQKVQSEYRYLVDVLGQPEGIETEAAACRAAFGPPEKVVPITRERRETPAESGAAKDEPPGSRLPKMSNRYKEFYAGQIAKGQYKGWDDPNLVKEMKIVGNRRQ